MENKFFSNIKPILAIFIVVASFGYFFFVTITKNKDEQIITAIVSILTVSISYYFGSSQGQSKKDETISNLSNKK